MNKLTTQMTIKMRLIFRMILTIKIKSWSMNFGR